jgi:hypothetical protein
LEINVSDMEMILSNDLSAATRVMTPNV